MMRLKYISSMTPVTTVRLQLSFFVSAFMNEGTENILAERWEWHNIPRREDALKNTLADESFDIYANKFDQETIFCVTHSIQGMFPRTLHP